LAQGWGVTVGRRFFLAKFATGLNGVKTYSPCPPDAPTTPPKTPLLPRANDANARSRLVRDDSPYPFPIPGFLASPSIPPFLPFIFSSFSKARQGQLALSVSDSWLPVPRRNRDEGRWLPP